MFIYALIVGDQQEHKTPTEALDEWS